MSRSQKALKSAVMLVGNGLAQKLIGLLSTLVLARVLLPDDFALVAIATLVIMFVEVFTITGSQQYILSQKRINKRILDSAWTLDIIVKSIASLIALGLAYPLGILYGNTDLTPILLSLSVMPLLAGLTNPGLWRLKRHQQYFLVISVQVTSKILGVIITIAIAITTKSYWALIVGQLFTTGANFLLSYIFCKYRPKITFTYIRKQYGFSSFMIGQELFGYLKSNIDTFFISKTFSNSEFGHFHVMKYIAVIPSLSIMVPLAEPLLVEMSKNNSIIEERLFKYTASLIALLLISFPISLMMYAHSEAIVQILLGQNWVSYHAILGFMGLLVTSFVIANHCKRALIIERKTKFVFFYEIIATLLVVLAVVVNLDEPITLLVKQRVLIEVFAVALFLIMTSYFYLKQTFMRFILKIVPITICLGFVWIGYFWVAQSISSALDTEIVAILLSVLLFSVGYPIVLLALFATGYRNTREGLHIYNLFKQSLSHLR